MKKVVIFLTILILIPVLLIGTATIMAMAFKDSISKQEKDMKLIKTGETAQNEQNTDEAVKELEKILNENKPPKVEFTNEALKKVIAEHPNYRAHKGGFPKEVGTDREWYDALKKIVSDESVKKYYSVNEGPINYIAYDIHGYIAIHYIEEIDNDKEKCRELDEEIYNVIVQTANKYGIEDVPVIFENYYKPSLLVK